MKQRGRRAGRTGLALRLEGKLADLHLWERSEERRGHPVILPFAAPGWTPGPLALPKRVLVVEGDRGLLRQTGEFLIARGLAVRCEGTVAGCFEALQDEAPDLVLLSACLPDGNALKVLNHIQREFPDLPVLVMASGQELEMEALKAQVFRALGEEEASSYAMEINF